mgnify:CR=1 FL=1
MQLSYLKSLFEYGWTRLEYGAFNPHSLVALFGAPLIALVFPRSFIDHILTLTAKKLLFRDPKSIYFYSSGRAALAGALELVGLSRGDKVIVSEFTCSAVLEALYFGGYEPIFANYNACDMSVSEQRLKEILEANHDIKAVIVQNFLGRDEFRHCLYLFRDREIKLVRDNCLAWPRRIDQSELWSYQYIVVSFELSKIISCGWGGALLTYADHEPPDLPANNDWFNEASDFFQILISATTLNLLPYKIAKKIQAVFYRFKMFRYSATSMLKTPNGDEKFINFSTNLSKWKRAFLIFQIYSALSREREHRALCTEILDRCRDLGLQARLDPIDLNKWLVPRIPVKVSVALNRQEWGDTVGFWFDRHPIVDLAFFKDVKSKLENNKLFSSTINIPAPMKFSAKEKRNIFRLIDRLAETQS